MPLAPEVAAMLEAAAALNLPPMHALDPVTVREANRTPLVENSISLHSVANSTIPGPAGEIPVRIYTPDGEGPFPLVVFYHGGGFVICDLDSHDSLCRSLCAKIGAVLVSVDYRLAPEAKFPAAPDDCYAATCWAVEHAAELGADSSRLCLAGDSAGGNLAAVVALMARERNGPQASHQLLIYPVTDRSCNSQSYIDNGEGYFLTSATMEWFWDHYLQSDDQAEHPWASPLLAELSDLPSATVITAEYDPLRDEGIAYAEALAAAGVDVEHKNFNGMIHGFVSMGGVTDQTEVAIDYLSERARAALG